METKILLTLCLMLLSATVICQPVPINSNELNEKIKLNCQNYNSQQPLLAQKFCFNPQTYAVFQAGLNTNSFRSKNDINLIAAYQSWCNCQTQEPANLDNYTKCAQDWVNQTINQIQEGTQPTCIPTLRPKTGRDLEDYQLENGQCGVNDASGNQAKNAMLKIMQRDCFNEEAMNTFNLTKNLASEFTKKEDLGYYFQMYCNCKPLGQKYAELDRQLACFKYPIDTAIQALPDGVAPVCTAYDSRPKNNKQMYEQISLFCDPEFVTLNQKLSMKNCYNNAKWADFLAQSSDVSQINFNSKNNLEIVNNIYCNCQPEGTDQAVNDYLTCAKSKIASSMAKYTGDAPTCIPTLKPRNDQQLYEQFVQCPDFEKQFTDYSGLSCFNDLEWSNFITSAQAQQPYEYSDKVDLNAAFQVLCNCQPRQNNDTFLTCFTELISKALELRVRGVKPTCSPTGRPRNNKQLYQLIDQCSNNNEIITSLQQRDCFNDVKWAQLNSQYPKTQTWTFTRSSDGSPILTLAYQVYCNCNNLTQGFTAIDDLLTCSKASVQQGLSLYRDNTAQIICPDTERPKHPKQLFESFQFCQNFATLNADLQQKDCFNDVQWNDFNTDILQYSDNIYTEQYSLNNAYQVYCNCQNTGVKAKDDFLTCVKDKINVKMAKLPGTPPTCLSTGRPRNQKQVLQNIQQCDNYAILNADLYTKDCFDEVKFDNLQSVANNSNQTTFTLKSQVTAFQVYCNCNLTGVTANDNFLICAKTAADKAIANANGLAPTCVATGRPRNMKQLVENLKQCTDYATLHSELQGKNCFNNNKYVNVEILANATSPSPFTSKDSLDNAYQTYCNCKPRGLLANDALLKCIQDKINASISTYTIGLLPTCGPISDLGNLPTKKEVLTNLSSCSTNVSDFMNQWKEAAQNNYCVNIQALNSMTQFFNTSEMELNPPIEKKDDASLESVYQLFCNCNSTTANLTLNVLTQCFKPKVDAFIARIKEGKAPSCLYRRPSTYQVATCSAKCTIENGTDYISQSSCVNVLEYIEFGEKLQNESGKIMNEISTPMALNLKKAFCNCNGASESQADIYLRCQRACTNPLDSDTEINAQVCTKPPTSVFSMIQCVSQSTCMNGTFDQYASAKLTGCINQKQCESAMPTGNLSISEQKLYLSDINQDQKKKLNNCICNCEGMQNEKEIRDVTKCLRDACFQPVKTESCDPLPVIQQDQKPNQGSYLYVELLLVLICLIY